MADRTSALKRKAMSLPSAAVMVTCNCCGGTGRVALTGEGLTTFQLLAGLGREVTGAELAKLAGIAATAMNNRLAALERFGLVTSRRWGRKRLYVVADFRRTD